MFSDEKILSRRELLRASLLSAGGVLLLAGAAAPLAWACDETPDQTEGPFYPDRGPVDVRLLKLLDKNNDLTFVDGRNGHARGQLLYVFGTVFDDACRPVANASVEIWQACVSGKYNDADDPTPYPLDQNFQYWGEATTGADGKYMFKTILPGAYRAGAGWVRPPHVHYKVRRNGREALTTQLYFSGTRFQFEGKTYSARTLGALNSRDQVLATVPAAERARVVAPVRTGMVGPAANAKYVTFDIVLP